MNKDKFIKGTIYLLIGSLITKALGMIIKIYYTRILGSDGIGYLSLINPTYSLLVTIAVFSLPNAISCIIARNQQSKKTILSTAPLILLFDLIFIILILLSSRFIATNLLHNKLLYYPIISIALTIPFITLSSIVKGYFFGNQKMMPYVISNIGEQIIRLIIIINVLPNLMNKSIIHTICGLFLINIFTELFSILIFSIFMPSKIKISIKDLKPDLNISHSVFSLAIPTVSSRIIGNISYFLEPIIITTTLLSVGYTNNFIINEYGIINGYVIPLLIFPSFVLSSLSTSLIPEISKLYKNNNIIRIKKIINKSLLICFSLGIIINIILYIFPSTFLKLLFNTNKGINYIKLLSLFFPLYYIETPLMSVIQAIGDPKHNLKITTYGCIIKLLLIFSLSYLKIGLYNLIIAEIINVIFVVLSELLYLRKCLNCNGK